MSKPFAYFRSSIGKKQLMAVAGLGLCGFLITHLAGNLLLLKGKQQFNDYAKFLTENPLLIPAELTLLAIFLLHMAAAVKLVLGNCQARPEGYMANNDMGLKYWPSSLMVAGGIIIFAFLIVHLVTFKFDPMSKKDLHYVVTTRFSNGLYVGFYVVTMIFIGLHLFHGFQSSFLTLGLDHPKYTMLIKAAGYLYAVAMTIGYSFIPLYIYLKQ